MKTRFFASLVVGSLTLGVASASATPITYLGTLQPGVQVTGINTQVPGSTTNPEGADYWQFYANAGDAVTVFGDRLASHYDMSFFILFGTFADTSAFGGSFDVTDSSFTAFGDDEAPPNIAGPFGDPLEAFVAPTTGFYTVAVTNFLSSAGPPNPYALQADGIQAVPEPASMILMGTGLVGLVIARRRARQ